MMSQSAVTAAANAEPAAAEYASQRLELPPAFCAKWVRTTELYPSRASLQVESFVLPIRVSLVCRFRVFIGSQPCESTVQKLAFYLADKRTAPLFSRVSLRKSSAVRRKYEAKR